MNPRGILERVDGFQRDHRPTAFAVGVVKKYGDDTGGNLAALLTYYGFISLFPLLLVAFTVLGYVLHGHPDWQRSVESSGLANFPVIGNQIASNVKTVHGNGPGLVVGLVGTLYGGLGITNAAQYAMNRAWDVPMPARPNFLKRNLRSLGLIASVGLGVVLTSVIGSAGSQFLDLGVLGSIGVSIGVAVLQIGVFLLAFVLMAAADVGWRDHLPGAIVAGILWQVLTTFGSVYVNHGLRGMSQTYGMFAFVLATLAFIYLQAQVFVYSVEINVVKARNLWPRRILEPPQPVSAG